MSSSPYLKKLSAAGVLVTLGIIFGDIGTSPLYGLKAIGGERPLTEVLFLAASPVFSGRSPYKHTYKYLLLTLQALNPVYGYYRLNYPVIRFSVQDFGPGIDPHYKDRIFDMFFRVPGPETIKGDTGLSLVIAQEFIKAKKGSIKVESELGSRRNI